jgi:hemerythrin-like domain-containing protein
MTYIKDLERVHVLLDDIFFDHRKALLHFDFEEALTLLEMYESILIRHMQDEELVLLPVYAERAEFSGAGSARYFFDDHAKMRSFVELFKEKTAGLERELNIDTTLLQLLDREAFYLRLCSHHDKRETDFLYPILEQLLSDDEERELMSKIDLDADRASIVRNRGTEGKR